MKYEPMDLYREVEFLRESNAIEGVFDADSLEQAILAWDFLKQQKTITQGIILKVHKILMVHQPLKPNERGNFRTIPIYIGNREGIHPALIANAIDNWLAIMNADYGKFTRQGIEEEIRDNHVLYEKIHPFVDGNGRTGRMFMNWQRMKLGLPILVIYN